MGKQRGKDGSWGFDTEDSDLEIEQGTETREQQSSGTYAYIGLSSSTGVGLGAVALTQKQYGGLVDGSKTLKDLKTYLLERAFQGDDVIIASKEARKTLIKHLSDKKATYTRVDSDNEQISLSESTVVSKILNLETAKMEGNTPYVEIKIAMDQGGGYASF